jgi:ergothioneine biosynthesis protein EgtB
MPLLLSAPVNRRSWLARFRRVRGASLAMCESLSPEEYRLQPCEEVSPPWWNLGHTSWFFMRNLLVPFGGQSEPEDDPYEYLLNSYYDSFGSRLPRAARGLVSRPTTDEIYTYRASVDRRMEELIATLDEERFEEFAEILAIGLQHEQQHQELFYTEIKYILAQNRPELRRPYTSCRGEGRTAEAPARRYVPFEGGLREFGHLDEGWCWDNELPVHRFFLTPYSLANRLVTCDEYLDFMADGGYANPLLWLDNGWQAAQREAWHAPLYWEQRYGGWWIWTLAGMRELIGEEPVCHVSYYEADAYARWRSQTFAGEQGARLPTEREWENAARIVGVPASAGPNSFPAGVPASAGSASFLDSGRLHPAAAVGVPASLGPEERLAIAQLHGELWQWTASYYEPYPGYRPFAGALAEYNGKFMDNQRVLRGGSCVTPRDHYRLSYRNFWPSTTRFQFTGIRLAQDAT